MDWDKNSLISEIKLSVTIIMKIIMMMIIIIVIVNKSKTREE